MISLRTPRSARENFGWTCEQLGVPATGLGALTTRLGASLIAVKQSGKTTSSLGTLLVPLEIIATTYHSTRFKPHVFSLYSHLSIYVATHPQTVYRYWLQAVLEWNSRSA